MRLGNHKQSNLLHPRLLRLQINNLLIKVQYVPSSHCFFTSFNLSQGPVQTAFLHKHDISIVNVENLITLPYSKDERYTRAFMSEIESVFKDIAQLNPFSATKYPMMTIRTPPRRRLSRNFSDYRPLQGAIRGKRASFLPVVLSPPLARHHRFFQSCSGGGGKSKAGIQAGTGGGAVQTPRTISTRSQKAGLQVWEIAPHVELPLWPIMSSFLLDVFIDIVNSEPNITYVSGPKPLCTRLLFLNTWPPKCSSWSLPVRIFALLIVVLASN